MVKDFKSAANAGPKRDFKQGGGAAGGFKKSFGGPGGNRGGPGGFNRGGGNFNRDQGPPERVEAVCTFSHTCGDQIIVKASNVTKVPKFNRGIYLENKTKVAVIDEIFGPLGGFFYSAKLVEGVSADSYKAGDKFYMGWEDTLPIDRFLPKPKGASGGPKRGPGGPKGGPGGFNRGGPGGFNRGGNTGGFNRGGNAGGFNKGGNAGGFNKGGNAGGFKKNFKN